MTTIYILLIGVPLILGLYAQMRVSSAYGKYQKVPVSSNLTGAQAANEILRVAQIGDVEVLQTQDFLGDHYDPVHKRLCLSPEVYNTPSVAAVGIAAHECGHAIQHARSYAPLAWRSAIVPVTQVASQALPLVILGGFLFGITGLITLGIICYAVIALFQLITLPVEFDASKRAKVILSQMGIVSGEKEVGGVNSVLSAAALTYVAAMVAALGNLIYLIMLRDRQ